MTWLLAFVLLNSSSLIRMSKSSKRTCLGLRRIACSRFCRFVIFPVYHRECSLISSCCLLSLPREGDAMVPEPPRLRGDRRAAEDGDDLPGAAPPPEPDDGDTAEKCDGECRVEERLEEEIDVGVRQREDG